MTVSQHFISWTCSDELDNVYLYYWLQHMKPVFERIAAGSTIKTIGLQFFKDLQIPLPPLREQQGLGKRMMEVDEAIVTDKKTLSRLSSLKSALLFDLVAGRKRVPIDTLAAAD
jgi:type I restriction enzyme S subunit